MGPDGTLDIADMYRGMIEGARMGEGRHLPARERSNSINSTRSTGHGRIWRLTYDGPRRGMRRGRTCSMKRRPS